MNNQRFLWILCAALTIIGPILAGVFGGFEYAIPPLVLGLFLFCWAAIE